MRSQRSNYLTLQLDFLASVIADFDPSNNVVWCVKKLTARTLCPASLLWITSSGPFRRRINCKSHTSRRPSHDLYLQRTTQNSTAQHTSYCPASNLHLSLVRSSAPQVQSTPTALFRSHRKCFTDDKNKSRWDFPLRAHCCISFQLITVYVTSP